MPEHREETREELDGDLLGEDYDPLGCVIASKDGEDFAYAIGIVDSGRLAAGRLEGEVETDVLPSHRGIGIEHEILVPVLAYLKGRGMKSALVRCETLSGWRNSAFEKTGFEDVHHWYRLLLDNPSYPEPFDVPHGYTLSSKMFKETTMEELSRFAEVITDSFTELFDYHPVTAKLMATMRDASADLQRVSWLERDGVVAGMCLSEESTEYNREHGAKMGYVLVLCVRKDSQGLGIGGSLLTDAIRWIMDRGMRQIYLSVDAENAGALGMYYRRGFRVLREGIYYRKQL